MLHPEQIDRWLLERYLAWLAPLGLADSTKAQVRSHLRGLLWRTTTATAGSRPFRSRR